MRGIRPARWLAAVSVIVLAAAFAPARAGGDQAPQGIVLFTDGSDVDGVAAQLTDVATGALQFGGQLAILECLDMPEGRDNTHTVYARYATVGTSPGGPLRFWLNIATHVQGSTQAMGGLARAATSEDHCGAAGIPSVTPLMMTCGSHGLLRDLR